MTDGWVTSKHQAFIVWTVHLQHDGKMLAFLLDFVKVPEVRFLFLLLLYFLLMVFESHTGVVLANAFQDMLECFGLEEKVEAHFLFQTCSANYYYLDSLHDC